MNDIELMKILTSLDKGEYLDKGGVDQALKELQSLIRTQKLEAMIDALEYAKISPKFRIEEKIEQLRLEAEE